MKKLIYVIAGLIMAFSLSANAQSLDKMSSYQDNINFANKFIGKVAHVDYVSQKTEGTQAVTWEPIILGFQPLFFSLYSRCTPMVYDPISDFVMISGIKSESVAGSLYKIIGEIYYKKPAATRWDSLRIFNEDEMAIANPSIVVNNYSNATTMANMSITMLGRYAASFNQWNFTGVTYTFKDGSDIVPDLSEYPESNNPGNQYTWNTMKMVSNGTSTESYAAGQLLVPMTTTVPAGAFGFLSTDVVNQGPIESTIPSEWAMSLFRSAPELTSTYNVAPDIAVDEDKNLYVAVNNIFADDENNRIPAVSVSTTGGDAWSTFNRMPASLLDNYKGSFEAVIAYQPYNSMNGFVAWGNNSYSYVYPVALVSQDTIREIHLIEAKYTAGAWAIAKIAELNGFLPYIFYASDLYPNADDKFRIDEAYLGYEIQASKTADGQYLVVKWVDQGLNPDGTGKVAEFSPAVSITMNDANNQEQDATIGSMTVLDIFIARRAVGQTNWKVTNVTNDDRSYKATWIPNIVPAINNIPILSASTAQYTDGTNPFNQLPLVLRDRIIEFACSYMYTRFTDPMDVEETTSNNSFRAFDVYPNPVTDLVEFTFEMPTAGNAKIEVFNSLGQSVHVVYNNFISEGLQGINADLSNLPSGVYYYTLTANGNSATKVLNVVK